MLLDLHTYTSHYAPVRSRAIRRLLFFGWGTPSANPSRLLEERQGYGRFPETSRSRSCQGDIGFLPVHTDGLDSDGLDSGEFLRWHEKNVSSLGHPCLTNNNGGFKRGTLGRDAKITKNDEHGYRTKNNRMAQRFHHFLRSVLFLSAQNLAFDTCLQSSWRPLVLQFYSDLRKICFTTVGVKKCMLDTLKKVTFFGWVCVSPVRQHFFSLQANLQREDVSNVRCSAPTEVQKTCPTYNEVHPPKCRRHVQRKM